MITRFLLFVCALSVAYPSCILAALADSARTIRNGHDLLAAPGGEATASAVISKGIDQTLTNSDLLLVQLPWSPTQTNLPALANWISTIAHRHQRTLAIAVDWQEPVRTRLLGAGKNPWRFANDRTRRLFLHSVTETASTYHPDYFVLGVEVNYYYAHLFPEDFAGFVQTFRAAKAQIKQVSPQTKVLVTFQYELMTGRDQSWSASPDFTPISAFGDELDLVGISAYPFLAGLKAADVSSRYFEALQTVHKPKAIFETSWPTPTHGAQREQAQYLERLLPICNVMRMRLLIWTATTDTTESPPSSDGDIHLHQSDWMKFLGLWELNCSPKQAVRVWQQWKPSDLHHP
ncbi:MAG TPA: glycosyl hydrolase 53 family protein [Verrucomicrobiae bacterium]|nr:glycosyl hydrolase 53 family protein [Verrucomicrobiae bacterium]